MRPFARKRMSIDVSAAVLFWPSCWGVVPWPAPPRAASAHAAKAAFLIIPHTHWEGAVFLDPGRIPRGRFTPHPAGPEDAEGLHRLPFVLDQACYVRPFLERYPEEEAAFRKFVKEGRLQVIGGTDCMPDVNMPGGESFIRQILYGKGYFRRKLDVDVTSLGNRHLRTPCPGTADSQALGLQGVLAEARPAELERSLGVLLGRNGRHADFNVLAAAGLHAFPGGHRSAARFTKFVKDGYDSLAPFTRGMGACRIGLAGGSVCPAEEHLPRMVEDTTAGPVLPAASSRRARRLRKNGRTAAPGPARVQGRTQPDLPGRL